MQLIFVHGGNAKSAELAISNGWLYGIREDYTPYNNVAMFDWNWKQTTTETRWQKYIKKIKTHKPLMAMVPDFEHPEQWPQLKQQILDVRRAGAQFVIVTPKFDGALDFIPRWKCFVIGVSVPTQYAGFLPQPEQLVNRAIHLLGGAPDQWQYLRNIYESENARVVSADGNFAWVQAYKYGKYWSLKNNGSYCELRGEGFDTEAIAQATLRNTKLYMKKRINNQDLIGRTRINICQKLLTQQLTLGI